MQANPALKPERNSKTALSGSASIRFIPLFDTHAKVTNSGVDEYEDDRPYITEYLAGFQSKFDARADYDAVRKFLNAYDDTPTTFNNYRTQVERLLLWAWNIRGKSFREFLRSDVEDFLSFCKKPDPSWIGTVIHARYIMIDGLYEPNPAWRPFLMRTQKSASKNALESNREVPAPTFNMADSSLKQVYAVLNSLFSYCAADRVMDSNPCVLIKRDMKKNKSKTLKMPRQKSLSKLQWEFLLETAELLSGDGDGCSLGGCELLSSW